MRIDQEIIILCCIYMCMHTVNCNAKILWDKSSRYFKFVKASVHTTFEYRIFSHSIE